jgi:hypothetical protein
MLHSGYFTFALAFVVSDELHFRVLSFRFTIRANDTKSLRPFQESIRRLRWLHWFRLLWFSQLQKLGAGDGKVLASAMRCNARSVVGYELPSNSAHKYIYDAVLRRIFPHPIQYNNIRPMAQWLAKDIDQVFFCPVIPRLSMFVLKTSIQIDDLPDDTEIVYSFWNGMPPETQIHVLELSSRCRSVRKLAVFRDENWSTSEKGQLQFSLHFNKCVLFETMHL